MKNKVIFIFLDGVGMGTANEYNPFYFSALPFIESLTSCKLIKGIEIISENLILKGIDACLGIPGLPQSATGQTALFTGINAAQRLGYHFPAFPDEQLTKIIYEQSLLKRAKENGFKATFANAYTPNYFTLVKEGKRQHSVTTLSVYAAGLNFRGLDDLASGNAVYWDITNEYLVMNFPEFNAQLIEPEIAGQNMAIMSKEHDLIVFECFLPDLIGHKRHKERAMKFLSSLDNFLYGIIKNINSDTTLIISSDHGNMENLKLSCHTDNPVLFLALGYAAKNFKNIRSITEVSDLIMQTLNNM